MDSLLRLRQLVCGASAGSMSQARKRIISANARAVVAYVVPFGLLAALFFAIAPRLAIDTDEAYYVLGGDRLFRGELPYRDFFFPQMPLTAFVFGAWSRVFGSGFTVARMLRVLLSAGIGLTIFHAVGRKTGFVSAAIATAYYGLSIQAINWMPRMKTYGLSSLLGLGALVVAISLTMTRKRSVFAGILASFALASRLLFAPIIPLVLLAILLRADLPWAKTWRYVGWVGIGVVAGILPVAALVALAPEQFYFDNIRYHALRSGVDSLVSDWDGKLQLLLSQLGLRDHDGRGEATQLLLVMPACLAGCHRFLRRERQLLVFPLAVILLLFVSLLPTPVWRQYLVSTVPPAIVTLSLLASGDFRHHRALQLALLVPYAIASWDAMGPLVMQTAPPYSPQIADNVGRVLRDHTTRHDVVASLEAHYLAASQRQVEPCSYNVFARGSWSQLPPNRVGAYHLCSDDDIARSIREGQAQAFVALPGGDLGMSQELRNKGWTEVLQPPATIWLSPSHRN